MKNLWQRRDKAVMQLQTQPARMELHAVQSQLEFSCTRCTQMGEVRHASKMSSWMRHLSTLSTIIDYHLLASTPIPRSASRLDSLCVSVRPFDRSMTLSGVSNHYGRLGRSAREPQTVDGEQNPAPILDLRLYRVSHAQSLKESRQTAHLVIEIVSGC